MPRIGDSGAQSERMIRAAALGQEARAKAHAEMMAEKRAQEGATRDMAFQGGQMLQQGQQFQQQQGQQQAQFEERMDMEAADRGLESPRMRQLKDTMAQAEQQRPPGMIGPMPPEAQGNLRAQTGQGQELDGARGPYRKSAERVQAEGREQTRREFEAQTDRMKAIAYLDQVGAQYQKNQLEGNKEEAEENAKAVAGPTNAMSKTFDRMMQGKQTDGDWDHLSRIASENALAPDLQADIKAKNWTPRVKQFLSAQISMNSIQAIIRTGRTKDLDIDWTSPKMQAFSQQRIAVNQQVASMGPEFAQYARINSIESKMEFVNKQAALRIYFGMDQIRKFDVNQSGMIEPEEEREMANRGQVQSFEGGEPKPEGPMPPLSAGNEVVNEAQQRQKLQSQLLTGGRQAPERGQSYGGMRL